MQHENTIVAYLKSHINKPITESPSAVAVWLGGTIKEVEEGKITIAYTVRNNMTNPAGTLHGGMASAIIDDAIGIAVFSLNQETFYTTINLAVDFLAAVSAGEVVIAKAKVVRKGSRLLNTECIIEDISGNLIARGTSNLISTNKVVGKKE